MIKIEDMMELIMDLVEDELALINKPRSTMEVQTSELFNFTAHKELKVLTKIRRHHKLS